MLLLLGGAAITVIVVAKIVQTPRENVTERGAKIAENCLYKLFEGAGSAAATVLLTRV